MKYQINKDLSVEITDKGVMSLRDVARLMLVLGNHKLDVDGEGFDVFVSGDTRLLVVYDGALDVSALAEQNTAEPYNPLADKALAQHIMRNYNIGLTPLVTVNGNLAAVWKAERLGPYMADEQVLLSNSDEPLSCVHENPITAIALCAALCIGVGRTAFVMFDAAGNAQVIYRCAENVQALAALGLGKTIFSASELDTFNATGATTDAVNAAISRCRDLYNAAKVADPTATATATAAVSDAASASQVTDPTPAADAGKDSPEQEQEAQPVA